MYPVYRDLRLRLGVPLWHDQHGVPRYDKFHPDLLGIYDEWAAAFLVQCQSCQETFPCATGQPNLIFVNGQPEFISDVETFLEQYVHWGDAPWHDGESQCAGTTMSTSIVKLLSVWHRTSGDWVELEITQDMTNLVTDW